MNTLFQFINFFIYILIPIILFIWIYKINKRLEKIEDIINKKL